MSDSQRDDTNNGVERKRAKVVKSVDNWVNGSHVSCTSGDRMDVLGPATGGVIGSVGLSNESDVDVAVKAARVAFESWSSQTIKTRVQSLIRFHELLKEHADELADLIVLEHGKTKVEALGGIAKGNETVEWAISMPQLIQGRYLEVSRGVTCRDVRKPLGVVASITPFNFPAMVPLWTLPICIAAGNCVVVKPSEKVPLTFVRIAELLSQAGVPNGVVNVVNGVSNAAQALVDHPDVDAVTFVGSTKVAELVAKRARNLNKRVLALGGAKNHLVALPDCNIDMTAQDVVNSFSGCTGQRCMAASVLLTVGEQKKLVDRVVEIASALKPGKELRNIGPVIDQMAVDRITQYIDQAEASGAKILLDGRTWTAKYNEGFWVGPTVIVHSNPQDPALHEEIFGPVLSVYQTADAKEAIAFENANPYGNAACVYTASAEAANWFSERFSVGMIGVNIGVPVPREPFSFGGVNASKFGDFDITGDGGMEFFTKRIKVTTKWNPPKERTWMD